MDKRLDRHAGIMCVARHLEKWKQSEVSSLLHSLQVSGRLNDSRGKGTEHTGCTCEGYTKRVPMDPWSEVGGGSFASRLHVVPHLKDRYRTTQSEVLTRTGSSVTGTTPQGLLCASRSPKRAPCEVPVYRTSRGEDRALGSSLFTPGPRLSIPLSLRVRLPLAAAVVVVAAGVHARQAHTPHAPRVWLTCGE